MKKKFINGVSFSLKEGIALIFKIMKRASQNLLQCIIANSALNELPLKTNIIKRMKISVLLILICTSGIFANTYSQGAMFTFQLNDVTVKEVFENIQEQSEFIIFYRDSQVNLERKVDIKAEESGVDLVLEQLFKGTNLTYDIIDRQIVIVPGKKADDNKKDKKQNLIDQPQKKTIKGKVTDKKGESLPGVSIVVKGTTIGITSDFDGNYTLEIPLDAQILVFSFVGMKSQEIVIGNQSQISVTLEEDAIGIEEVVAVGYGVQNKRDVTTSIVSLKSEQIEGTPAAGLDKAIAGKVSGVQILETSGAPGSGINVRIRGTNTISAGNEPLYVIDGIPVSNETENGPGARINPLNMLNISDIKSIEILKDASAAAIYGSRGSNGVVLITTKTGKKGKPVFSYNGYYGVQQTSKKVDMLDAYQYAEMAYEAHNNAYLDWLSSKGKEGSINDTNEERSAKGASSDKLVPPELLPYLSGQQGLVNTDWQDEVLRNASMQNHTLSVSGGNENVSYFVSGNYLNQEGIVISSGFEKFGGRMNLNLNYEKFKLGIRFSPTYAEHDVVPTTGRFKEENIVSSALLAHPIWPVYDGNGDFTYNQNAWEYAHAKMVQPVALAMLKEDKIKHTQLIGNVFGEYEILPNLKYKVSFGYDLNSFRRSYYRPSALPDRGRTGPSTPDGESRTKAIYNWVVENTISYNLIEGDHNISAIAGFSAQKEHGESNRIAGTDYPNDLVKTLNAAPLVTKWDSYEYDWSLLSYLGRAQYDYKGKYLLSAAIRTDGSSRFGKDNKWGYFPSISAGWRVSEEDFFPESKSISSLKLRGSYGLTGNFNIGNYEHIARLTDDNYIYGQNEGELNVGLHPSGASNSELGWEKTAMLNVGMDVGFWNNKLRAEFDFYDGNTSDLLLNVPVPRTSGFSTVRQNIGKVNNRGFELTLSADHNIGKAKFSHSLNYSRNKNKVVDLGGIDQLPLVRRDNVYFITKVGESIGSFYTLIYDGVFKNQAEIDDPNTPTVPGAKPGDFKFIDVSGDGVIDADDNTITGNYAPDFTYGYSASIEYDGFDLGVAIQGVYGNEIMNIYQRYINNMEGYGNNMADALNRWKSESDPGNGLVNRANRRSTGRNSWASTWHLEDGSYLRIRNITVGYTFPESIVSKVNLSKLRLYVTAQNPFTFTKYNGYNPEVSNHNNPETPGIDYGTYPVAKSISFGLNLNF